MSARVSPTERLGAGIGQVLTEPGDLAGAIEQAARLGPRPLLTSALEAEVTQFLGRVRCLLADREPLTVYLRFPRDHCHDPRPGRLPAPPQRAPPWPDSRHPGKGGQFPWPALAGPYLTRLEGEQWAASKTRLPS